MYVTVCIQEHLSRAKATTFNLISSHGRIDELLYFATVIEDYERVISLYIQQADYLNALKVLSSQVYPSYLSCS